MPSYKHLILISDCLLNYKTPNLCILSNDINDINSSYGNSWQSLCFRHAHVAFCSADESNIAIIIRSGAVFRSEGSPSNPKDLCHFQLEVKDVCWKHRRSFGFKGQPHKSFRSEGLARVPSMKSI